MTLRTQTAALTALVIGTLLMSCAHTERAGDDRQARELVDADNHSAALDQTRALADQSFERGDFEAASMLYADLLRSCARLSPSQRPTSCEHSSLKERQRTARTQVLRKQALQNERAGNHQAALEAFRTALALSPKDRELLRDYARTIEETKRAGDRTYESEDCARAGRIYHAVWKTYPHKPPLARQISFEKDAVQEKMRACRDCLFRRALEQYRRSDLESALTLWRNILVFYPEDEDTRKAIATTLLQKERLQSSAN